jgi:hypothetical protein
VPAGYSGTPLPKKLGIKAPMNLVVLGAPSNCAALVGELPVGVHFGDVPTKTTTMVHLFSTNRADLTSWLVKLRKSLGNEASVWVSWPKRTSKVATDITEDTIRELALPLGFVDIKVCAVSAVWSGLKLVVRKELRGAA